MRLSGKMEHRGRLRGAAAWATSSARQLLLLLFILSTGCVLKGGASSASFVQNLVENIIEEVNEREATLAKALGPYKIYIYEGGAFDAVTKDLLRHHKQPDFNEYRASIWIHRALQHDPSRTMDPEQADIFFVPGYLQMSVDQSNVVGTGRQRKMPENEVRLKDWRKELHDSPWFKRYNGADHLFAVGDVNPGWAVENGIRFVHETMGAGFIGTFEMNDAWAGGWAYPRMIVMPYVATDAVVEEFLDLHNSTFEKVSFAPRLEIKRDIENIMSMVQRRRHVSIFFSASERKNAIGWANCSRRELLKLSEFPNAVIHVADRRRRRLQEEPNVNVEFRSHRRLKVAENMYAAQMGRSGLCPLMCGDTPTSRRTFDAYVSGCIPLFVGTRLWGRCDKPCKPGWGWRVSGAEYPHLPFHGLWIDWARMPLLDELSLVTADSSEQAIESLRRTLEYGLAYHGPTYPSQLTISRGVIGMIRARTYLMATRRNLVYGRGDSKTSTNFGLAPRRLVEAALFKIRSGDDQALQIKRDPKMPRQTKSTIPPADWYKRSNSRFGLEAKIAQQILIRSIVQPRLAPGVEESWPSNTSLLTDSFGEKEKERQKESAPAIDKLQSVLFRNGLLSRREIPHMALPSTAESTVNEEMTKDGTFGAIRNELFGWMQSNKHPPRIT